MELISRPLGFRFKQTAAPRKAAQGGPRLALRVSGGGVDLGLTSGAGVFSWFLTPPGLANEKHVQGWPDGMTT